MDLTPLGLRFRPFLSKPDPDGYYPAPAHDDALARVVSAITEDEPFVAITGEPGLGKTLLAHLAVQQFGDDVTVSFVTNCRCDRPAELLQAILFDFGLPYAGRPQQELRLALTDFAFCNLRDGKRTLIVLDEAHLLSVELFQEVRLLANLESPRGRAVQTILLGLNGLADTIEHPSLETFAQRLTTRVRLEPFSAQDSIEYIGFQIERAEGNPDKLFSDEALELLARCSRGIPRLLNQATYGAMLLALKAQMTVVDAEAAHEALAGLPYAALPIAIEEPPAAEPEPLPPDAVMNDDALDRPDSIPWQQGPYLGDYAPPAAGPQRFVFAPATPH